MRKPERQAPRGRMGRAGKLAKHEGIRRVAAVVEHVKALDEAFVNVCLLPGALVTHFQPIVNLQLGRPALWALECLTRGPAGSRYESADVLFSQARALNLEPEVDRACIATALETVSAAELPHRLFINVHPATLERDRGFGRFLATTARRCGITL